MIETVIVNLKGNEGYSKNERNNKQLKERGKEEERKLLKRKEGALFEHLHELLLLKGQPGRLSTLCRIVCSWILNCMIAIHIAIVRETAAFLEWFQLKRRHGDDCAHKALNRMMR